MDFKGARAITIMKNHKLTLAISLICLSFFIISPAHALDIKNASENILLEFKNSAAAWGGVLLGYAKGLFWLLATIEFIWMAIRLVIKGADFTELSAEIVRKIIYIGFFYTLMVNSMNWSNDIVSSMRNAAGAASGVTALTPGDLFAAGMDIGTKFLSKIDILNISNAILRALSGLSIIVCYGLICANIIEALVEAYIMIPAGVIFMGFGGSSWTNEWAKKQMTYALSIGAKLFVLQLIAGLCFTISVDLNSNITGDSLNDAYVMVGVALIMWVITLNIPNKVQGLINGTTIGSGGTLVGVAATAATAAVAAVGTVASAGTGGVSAVTAAARLADAQGKPGIGQMSRNLFDAGKENLSQRMAGEIRKDGNAGVQMSRAMDRDANTINNGFDSYPTQASSRMPQSGLNDPTPPDPSRTKYNHGVSWLREEDLNDD